jgi:hypothetical protein
MKKVKFTSLFKYSNYVEETEDGKLVDHAVFWTTPEEIVADVLEERKYTYKLALPNGRKIIKKKHQVEIVNG